MLGPDAAMTLLALLLIGYSLFSALALALTHFRDEAYATRAWGRAMGLALLFALSVLQLAHLAWLHFGAPWIDALPYRLALFAVAPAFYLFARSLLAPPVEAQPMAALGHFAPLLLALALPREQALPLAFALGAGYLVWLARSVYRLRAERASFRTELALLGTVFVIALGVTALGLAQHSLPGKSFFAIYAMAIGVAFSLVQVTLAARPHLGAEIGETVRAAYASSTLARVDCDAALARLETLMRERQRYTDPELDLAGLARELDLAPHQLSELLNTRLGKSFSRYLREQRVAAAKRMLLAEPAASVLSVGLSVGFSAQSNFYEAFREIEGSAPGQFRKLNLKPGEPK